MMDYERKYLGDSLWDITITNSKNEKVLLYRIRKVHDDMFRLYPFPEGEDNLRYIEWMITDLNYYDAHKFIDMIMSLYKQGITFMGVINMVHVKGSEWE